jgi:ACS family hexuronate transporter-like MFS transporter
VPSNKRPWPRLRWWIGGLLFASTVINYIDRQALSVLAPHLKVEFHWNNEDFAIVIIAFRVAYALGQTVSGRLLDRVGTRKGLSFTVLFYSISAALASFTSGLRSLSFFRFLLGAGESANWPGATKAVAEWFPAKERSWAVALFDSGSSIGGAIAPFLVFWLFHTFGDWRPVFVVTASLGLLWLAAWRILYHPPETHPRLSAAEREMILRERSPGEQSSEKTPWRRLLRLPQTWGIVLGRSLTDPVWFFITDWFPIYLVSKHIPLQEGLIAVWIPFIAADVGNFFGGGMSSWLIRRGWPVLRARKALMIGGGLGMMLMIFAATTSNVYALAALFAVSTFAYAAWSTMDIVLPADLYPRDAVATVSGMSGTGAGIGTILSSYLIGRISDHYSFEPIIICASLIPLVATALVLTLVRRPLPGGEIAAGSVK